MKNAHRGHGVKAAGGRSTKALTTKAHRLLSLVEKDFMPPRTITDFDREHNPYLMKWLEGGGDVDYTASVENIVEHVAKEIELVAAMKDQMDLGMKLFSLRDACIAEYGFAIPDWTALNIIKKCSPGGVVEIGCGTGYWASLLEKLDVEVRAYDTMAGKTRHGFRTAWSAVIPANHEIALAVPQNNARTLLLCWPTLGDPWAHESLKLFGGSTVVYVGEWRACTADEGFHDELEESWTEIADYGIPQWWGIHDRLMVYERKR